MFFGLTLIFVGVIMLLEKRDILSWGFGTYCPVILFAFGVSIFVSHQCRSRDCMRSSFQPAELTVNLSFRVRAKNLIIIRTTLVPESTRCIGFARHKRCQTDWSRTRSNDLERRHFHGNLNF